MAKRAFNDSMDEYIASVRTKKPKSFSPSEEEETVPENLSSSAIYIIKKPKTWFHKVVDSFKKTDEEDFDEHIEKKTEEPVEEVQEFEEDYEQMKEKKGFFGWLSSLFSSKVDEAYQDIDDEKNIEHEEVEEQPEEIEPVQEKQSWWKSVLSFINGPDEEYEEIEEEPEEEKEDPSMEKMIEIREDLKQIAVISTATFKKLPKREFAFFKESEDFKKFKSILEKHNIIRHKE